MNRDPISSLQAATKQYVDSNDVVKLLYKGVKKGNQNLEIPVTWNMSKFSFLRIIINKVHSSWESWGMNISLNNLSQKSLFTVSDSGNLSFNILLMEIYEKTSLRVENSGITFSGSSFHLYFDTPFNNVNKITFYGNHIDDDADFYIYGYKK